MALEATYSSKNFLASLGEANLVGRGPDTFIEIAFNTPDASLQIGSDGEANTRSLSGDESATITFTCSQHAPVNDILTIIAEQDRLLGLGVRPFGCLDKATGAKYSAADCFISARPKASYAATSGVNVWEFQTDKLTAIYGDPSTRS